VIDSGLRLLGRQSDPRERDLVMGRMRGAIARAAVLSRGLLDTAWRR
jgi:hypothetical protein